MALAAVLALSAAPAPAAGTIVLDDSIGSVALAPYLDVLEDESHELAIADILSAEEQAKFVKDRPDSYYGYSSSFFWTRFTIRNDSKTQLKWILKLETPWFDSAELYSPNEDGSYAMKRSSYYRAQAKRDIKNRLVVFSVLLEPGRERTYYMKFLGEASMDLDTTLYSYDAFMREDHDSQMFFGIVYGIMLVMACYNLFLFFVLRDRSYLYYSLFVLFYGLQRFSDNLHIYEYYPLFTGQAVWYSYFPILGGMIIFAILFAMSFLSMRKYMPLLNKLCYPQIALCLVMMPCGNLFPGLFWDTAKNVMIIAACLTGLGAGITCAVRGIRSARFYLIGWIVFLISNILGMTLGFFVPSFKLGILSDLNPVILVLLLSIALADRYRYIRLEKERAERTNIEQTDFFVNLSHEIKTPLTLVANYLDKYMEGREASPELLVVKRSIDKLLRDMVNFFDVLRLQKGIHVYSHDKIVDLSGFLRTKAELFRSTAAAFGLDMRSELEDGLFLEVDPAALDRIVNNLVENAIKYNRPGGELGLSLKARDGKVLIAVSDTGVGIAPDQFEKIFLPYYQISHKKSNAQGIGMGLSIVKDIVVQLGGAIDVKSEPGKGSRFSVELPRRELHMGEVAIDEESYFYPALSSLAPSGSVDDAKGKDEDHSVLIVEDNAELRRLLVERVSERYSAYAASNGIEALRKLESIAKPDVIVSDVMMDLMDGYAFFDEASKNERYANIPFIFITAKSAVDEKLKGLRKGAVDFIFKPFAIDELLSKIESLIRYQDLKKESFEKDKFASIGMLIGGVSHEIYNPLSGINAPLANIRKMIRGTELEGNERLEKYFNYIEINVRRIEDLIANLRILYADVEYGKEPVSLEAVIDEALAAVGTEARGGLRVVKDLGGCAQIPANKHALFLIMRNLIANGVDSIEGEGEIRVRARRGRDGISVSVGDTGSGIGREELDKIFNAFYTTKDAGKGLGLGLYIVKDLVLKMGWDIKVKSTLGEGTTFTIRVED
jgi:signal transduction histidine kinase